LFRVMWWRTQCWPLLAGLHFCSYQYSLSPISWFISKESE
jgi:hypothetical protein